MAEPVELHDVQGNILNGYPHRHAAYLFLRATSTEAARQCLSDVLDHGVTTAVPWPGARPPSTLNVAVTYTGFARLGLPDTLLDQFPQVFRESPEKRAGLLGDIGPSGPEHWAPGLRDRRAHLLLTVYAHDEPGLAAAVAKLKRRIGAPGEALEIVHEQEAHGMPGKREHFGYADGFSQPDVEGVPRLTGSRKAVTRGHGVPLDDLGWRPLKVGEFLLGYTDEDGQVDGRPEAGLVRNGTYLVYRTLRQDVARFRRGLTEAAEACGLSEELVAAKVVGRWRDGTPLELSPDHDDGDLTDEALEDPPNDFRYLPHDRAGYTCPVGAHIRRSNPRDALGFGGALTARHRIIRRGMPYGDPLPAGTDDDVDRGLVFVCFNADIERQFETVQAQWCNDGDAFGLGDDRDYLLGDTGGTGKMTIPVRGSHPRFVKAQPEIVLTRGAEYLFTPGIAALHSLAAGSVGRRPRP